MIATVDPRQEHLHESVSTCRFAQRVAMIENTVIVNEEVDPKLLVKRLKQEIRMLKASPLVRRRRREKRELTDKKTLDGSFIHLGKWVMYRTPKNYVSRPNSVASCSSASSQRTVDSGRSHL